MMDRREVLKTILYLSISMHPAGSACANWPKSYRESRLQAGLARGCTLTAAAKDDLSTGRIRVLRSCGNQTIDQLIRLESQVISNITFYKPGFAFLDDIESPNAFATDANLLNSRHGSVLFGVQLLREEIKKLGPLWDAAVIFIMAHEWGHIAEFNNHVKGSSKQMELLADYVAGWYLGWKHINGKVFNASGATRSVFEKGDYAFNSPTHHGTPQERLYATELGYRLATHFHITQFSAAFNYGRREIGI